MYTGGIPHWINTIPGMSVRSTNEPWQKEMSRFFTDIVNMARPFFANNGGPIILGQVENEFRYSDPEYVSWCGELVEEVDPGIPFIMCNGYSANNTINTYNGNDGALYAEGHAQKYPNQPLAWTENEGWFQSWDKLPGAHGNRTAEDMASVVMKWFARGGSHHNYYMWYGGNNFGRRAGSCITTEYANGVNLMSDGLANQPKKVHLQRLHYHLSKYANVLLDSPSQVNNTQTVLLFNTTTGKFVNATKQFAYVYGSGKKGSPGVAFVENSDNMGVLVNFMDQNFTLPPMSSTLVDTEKCTELFSSGKVNTAGIPTVRTYVTKIENLSWKAWEEDVTHLSGGFQNGYPLEQLNVTNDLTDYLFYQVNITTDKSGKMDLMVESRKSNSLIAYLDGKFGTSAEQCEHNEGGMNFTLSVVSAAAGKPQTLTILSVSLGVNTHTEPGEYDLKGITGHVWLDSKDITKLSWLHRPKLEGEILQVYTIEGAKKVTWSSNWEYYTGKTLVWYQFVFQKPGVNTGHSLLLDLSGMNRGYIYLNGMNLGRYWMVEIDGQDVQQYYYVPQSILMDKDNMLVLCEELGASDPQKVRFVTSTLE